MPLHGVAVHPQFARDVALLHVSEMPQDKAACYVPGLGQLDHPRRGHGGDLESELELHTARECSRSTTHL